MKNILLSLFLILALFANAQDSYEIDVKIKDYKSEVLLLANYYGDKTYLADTAKMKGKGHFVFKKNEKLGGGIYIIVSDDKKSMFEIIVPGSTTLKFETQGPDYIKNMKVSNSIENQLFFDYLKYSGELYTKVKPLNDRYQQIDKESDSAEILKNEITQLNKQMNDYKENLVEENPQTFIASFFRLMTESKIPDTMPTLPDGSKDSSYPYRYYKKHFWDGIDLGDDRLIRTPVFFKKLDTYFDQVVSKNPDSIVYEIDHLLSQMDENGEMFKFSLWHLTVKFDESQIMGHDAILVHMADNYFALGKAYWMDKQVVQNVLDEAEKRRLSLIGKTAPNLIMQDTNFAPRSLHDIKNNYTVLYFWDPECGHCKKETPKLVEFYETDASEMDVEIFAVCADTNMAKMKSYIKEKNMSFINVNGPRSYTQDYHDLYNVFSTPIIIVLDNEKKIIAKRLASDQLKQFILDHDKMVRTEND